MAQLLPNAQIRCAAGGGEALGLLTSSRPDLVILDLHIPQIDGCRLLEFVKCNGENDAMIVLVISAFDEDLAQIGQHGYAKVFSFNKPMRADELEHVLREAVALVPDRAPTRLYPADPLVDRSHMRLYISHDSQVQREVAGHFLDDAKDWTHALHHHLLADDRAALAECARNVWAAASTMGAHDAAKLAHRLSFAARDDPSARAASLCEQLRTALDAYCTALSAAFTPDDARR